MITKKQWEQQAFTTCGLLLSLQALRKNKEVMFCKIKNKQELVVAIEATF